MFFSVQHIHDPSPSRRHVFLMAFCLFFKEYEAIYLAKLTIKMMSPMQLGRSFSLQAGVAGLCPSPLLSSGSLVTETHFNPVDPVWSGH